MSLTFLLFIIIKNKYKEFFHKKYMFIIHIIYQYKWKYIRKKIILVCINYIFNEKKFKIKKLNYYIIKENI